MDAGQGAGRSRRRFAAFWIAAGTSALLVAAGLLVLALAERLGVPPGKPRGQLRGALAFAVGLWTTLVLVRLAWRSRWPRSATLAVLLVCWLAFEVLAPPWVGGLVDLRFARFIQDVDHIDPPSGVVVNSDLLRGAAEPGAYRPEDLNLIFLGDSYTYGWLLEYEQSFPYLVGELLAERIPERRPRAINFGWASSSPLLSWRRLSAIAEKYSPDWVLMCVDMTDFADDIRYEGMLERRGLYRFYDKFPVALGLLRAAAPGTFKRLLAWSVGGPPPEARFFVTEAPLEQTRPWCEPLRRNLQRIADWCRERSVAFLVVVLPRGYQYSDRESPENWEARRYTVLGPHSLEPFRWFEELAREVDYPIVSLLDDFLETDVFPTCFENDPHWNADGARIAAQAIARELLERIEH